MNLFAIILITVITSFGALFSHAGEVLGDSGTVRMTWNEFVTSAKDCGMIKIGKAYVNRESGDEWNKYEVRFTITNTGKSEIKVRFLISVFDSNQQLIFVGSKDKSFDSLEANEVKSEAKISNRVKFEPETVYVRCWWEVKGDK